jgi:diaminopimelate decarboxylase
MQHNEGPASRWHGASDPSSAEAQPPFGKHIVRHFRYVENQLQCEDVVIAEIAEEFGTPLYVYSKAQLLDNYRAIRQALTSPGSVVCYAMKANANEAILRLLAQEGAGADVVSGGELYLALRNGFAPEKIVFAGVGKTDEEIEYALRSHIHAFNVESAQELHRISKLAFLSKQTANILLRVNPDIDAQSHPYISTGLRDHKFGISGEQAFEAFRTASTLPNVTIRGIHMHIGSQITSVEPYRQAAQFASSLADQLRTSGISIQQVDVGGGFGVRYKDALQHEALPREEQEQGSLPAPADFVSAIMGALGDNQYSVWLEPGRSIVADAGILVTRVLHTKDQGTKTFVIVDAGMNDLLRPSLYNAHHQIVPATIDTYDHHIVDVVGPVCETGDFFARGRMLLKTKPNDALAILTTGAYGIVNASNYNGRLRPAEILVSGDKVRVIRKRQTLEDLHS